MPLLYRAKIALKSLPLSYKRVLMVGLDLFLIPFALWLALSLRYGELYSSFDRAFLAFAGLVAFTIPVFARLGLYRAVMRFLGWRAIEQIAMGVAASTAILLAIMLLRPELGLPRSTFAIYGLVLFFLVAGSRYLVRRMLGVRPSAANKERVAIYGAGAGGQQVVSLLRQGGEYEPVVFLDDDPSLQGRDVDDLRVLAAGSAALEEQLAQLGVTSILLSIPSASATVRRDILRRLEPLPFHVRTVPSLDEIVSGSARLDQVQEVDIEDLLGRDPVPPNENLLHHCIEGKSVLVTGAGGSIGSELSRQIVALGAKRLVMLELSEFALYQVDSELRGLERVGLGEIEIVPVLASVLDGKKLTRLIDRYGVETIYHAAAYKHVPLVEHNPIEGLRNNVLGTLRVAEAAAQAGVAHLVLISTDKAVRPTNVMGASKRLAEMVLQGLQTRFPETVFCMVRFGNVLGSSGSVVPLFRRQIAAGGPVTVTHPDITRFFMTIPEAVQLVIQAGSMAEGGEVFVLDMGEPVKIAYLARRMVHLSGLRVRDEAHPEGDIELVFTGLRPGEKLYEELLIGDAVSGTSHPRIMQASEDHLPWERLEAELAALQTDMDGEVCSAIRERLVRLVDGFKPQEQLDQYCSRGVRQR